MSKKDYYEVLNLKNDCTPKDVKKNFHKLALVWHPDKHSDKTEAEKKFQEIHEAYCVLMDENKRKIYDTRGFAGLNCSQDKTNFNPFNAENFFSAGCFNNKSKKSPFEIFRDIFKDNEDDEDDDFYKTFYDCDPCGMPNSMNKNIKTFIEEAFESSENEDPEAFFKGYKPSFMDTEFFSTPIFKTFDSQNGYCSSSEIFSSFFPSQNAEAQSYSRTSSTVCNSQGNCKTSVKEIFKKGDKVIEKERNFVFDAKNLAKKREEECLNKKRCAKPINGKNKEFIVIEDSDNEDNGGTKMNTKKPTIERNQKDGRQTQAPNNCMFNNDSFAFEFNASDDDFNLLFANMDRLGQFKRNKK